MDPLDRGAKNEARQFLQAALQWPEHLGQGRPYEPEERLVTYLLGQVESRLGDRDRARLAFEAVVAATDLTPATMSRLDLLVIPSLVALGRLETLGEITYDADTEVGRFARDLIRVLQRGGSVAEAAAQLGSKHAGLFEDLPGRILLRVLGTQ